MLTKSDTALRPEPLLATDCLFLLIAFWFGSYLYEYVLDQYEVKPLYSYFLLIGLASVHVLWSASRRDALPVRGRGITGLYCWMAAYLVYGVLEYLHSPQDTVTTQALIDLCEMVALAVAFAAFLRKPELLHRFSFLLCVIALIGSALDFVDFVTPEFSEIPGRAAGLYVNPTIAGNAIALAMIGGLDAVSRRLRIPYLVICGLGVFLTFSRESWLTWGAGLLLLALRNLWSGQRLRAIVLVAVTTIAAAVLVEGSLEDYAMHTPIAHYLTPNTAARIGVGGALLEDQAAMERKSLIGDSLHEGEIAPWTGRGLGFTQEWNYRVGPHDMYLLFFVEGGVPGLVLFLALMLLMWMCGAGTSRILAVQIVVSSFFSHNHLDQPVIVMIMTYALAHGDASRWLAERNFVAKLRHDAAGSLSGRALSRSY